jgi:hypothetical protein
MESIEEARQRTAEALAGLEAASSFAEARRHWSDYLVYWRRTLNRIDIQGTQKDRKGWIKSDSIAKVDQALSYLWAARNEDEHGLQEIATRLSDKIQIGGSGYNGYIQSIVAGPGYIHVQHEPHPCSWNIAPATYHPEALKLVDIANRDGVFPAPSGPAYALTKPSAPVVLGREGLRFIARRIADLQS